MDECDTAAMIYQCGKEQAPDFISNIINTVEVNSSSVSLNVTLFIGVKLFQAPFLIRNRFHYLPLLQFALWTMNAS
jgi:hypothetical protein